MLSASVLLSIVIFTQRSIIPGFAKVPLCFVGQKCDHSALDSTKPRAHRQVSKTTFFLSLKSIILDF